MDLEKMLVSGELKVVYSAFTLEGDVDKFLGLPRNTLYSFFLKHPDVPRLSWLKMPDHLNLRWLQYQSSEALNQKLRSEYQELGYTGFEAKYHPGGNIRRIREYLGIQHGQKNYIPSRTQEGYSFHVNVNPLLVESDFKYWFLGYFLGDGNMMKKARRVSIASTDKQLVDLLYQAFGVDSTKVRGYQSKGTVLPVYSFHTSDSSVRSVLEEYRFLPNKSCLGWNGWELIPDKYRPAFLRGLYESDGSYGIEPERSRWMLCWLGHQSYMISVAEYLGVSALRRGSLCYVQISNRCTRLFIRSMYPTTEGLGTPEYPSNLRKAYKALEVLNES